jgi:hypothetical protein
MDGSKSSSIDCLPQSKIFLIEGDEINRQYQPVVKKVTVLSSVVVRVQDDVTISGVKFSIIFFRNLKQDMEGYVFKITHLQFTNFL